jgi:serine protease inhibitor
MWLVTRSIKPIASLRLKPARSVAVLAIAIGCIVSAPVASAQDLGFRAWRLIAQQHPAETAIASPVGLEAALKLLEAGAGGWTRAELNAALGEESGRGIPAGFEGEPDVTLGFASCLWSPPRLHFAREFAQRAARDYVAVTMTTSAQAAPAAINKWAKEATRGLVPSVIRDPPDEGGLVLANAVAFMGKWADPFDPALTASAPFRAINGHEVPVAMMAQSGRFRHATVADGQLLDLPYGGGRYGFTIFLPDAPDGLVSWIERIDLGGWRGLVAQLIEGPGELRLPRLDLSYGVDAKGTLSALGITAAFRPDEADFAAMTEEHASIYVEKIRLQTALKLDESGTRAAATAVIEMAPTAAAPRSPFRMIVDHPFFFALHGPVPDQLLFVGAVRSL